MPDQDAMLAAIGDVRGDIRALRTEFAGRLDQTVTRREHDAEFKRIDADAKATKIAFDAYVDRRRSDLRWMAMWVVGAVGATAAIVQLIGG